MAKDDSRAYISLAMAQSCGARALKRRNQLGLARNNIAAKIGVSEQSLRKWESLGAPRKIRKSHLSAWETALNMPNGSLLADDEEYVPPPVSSDSLQIVMEENTSLSQAIVTIGERIARRGHRIRSTDYSGCSPSEKRNATVFAARYGVFGNDASLLENIGNHEGITRERVRQIVQSLLEKTPRFSFAIPVLEKLSKAINDLAPAPVSLLTKELRTLLGEQLTIEDANRFSIEVLGKQLVRLSTPVNSGIGPKTEATAYHPETPHDNHIEGFKALRTIAYRMIRSAGAAHLSTVAGEAFREKILSGTDKNLRTLMAVEGFEWLDEDECWFWFGPNAPAMNPIIRAMRRVFSVATGTHAIDVTDLIAAIARMRVSTSRREFDRPRGLMLSPPMHIVRAVLERLDWLQVVQHDDFRATVPLKPEEELSESELLIFQTMSALGGVASRAELTALLVDTGQMISVTCSLTIDTSPIINRIGLGIYTLRGWPMNVPALTRSAGKVGNQGRYGGIQRHAEGEVSFSFMLTEFAAKEKVCVLPAALLTIVPPGQYTVTNSGDKIDCVLRQSGAQALNRIVQSMRTLDFEIGAVINVKIHPLQKTIMLTANLTDEELP